MSGNHQVCLFSEIEAEVSKKVDLRVTTFLQDKLFQVSDNDYFVNSLSDMILKELSSISSNFKYIINLSLFKNDNSHMVEGVFGLINRETDGFYQKKYIFDGIGCLALVIVIAL